MRLNKLSEELQEIIKNNEPKHEKIDPDWLRPYLEKQKLSDLTFEGLLGKDGERTFFVKFRVQLYFLFFLLINVENRYKCSEKACNQRLVFKNGHPYFRALGTHIYKKSSIIQHCISHHKAASSREGSPARKRKRQAGQMTLSLKRSLSDETIDKIRLLKVEMISELGLSFKQISSDIFREYEQLLWESSTGNWSDFEKLPWSRSKLILVFMYFHTISRSQF